MKLKKILITFFLVSNLYGQDMYFCMAADSNFMDWLLSLIGSIHRVNFNETKEIAVFNLGFTPKDLALLNSIQKVKVYNVELTHPDLLKKFVVRKNGKIARGWYAWKPVVIKQALEKFPYVLYLDAGCAVLKPLNCIFDYIKQNGYLLIRKELRKQDNEKIRKKRIKRLAIKNCTTQYVKDKFLQNVPNKDKILNSLTLEAGIMGYSKKMEKSFVLPMYNFTKDIRNFADDGTCSNGFGTCLHDQSLYSIHAYKQNLKFLPLRKENKTKSCTIYISDNKLKNPVILWHSKGKVSFKNYIKFK